MQLCINPKCISYHLPIDLIYSYCPQCSSNLLLQGRYRVNKILRDYENISTVYEVDDHGKPKVLKLLKPNLKDSFLMRLQIIYQFWREFNILKNLNHPNISKVEDYFQHQLSDGKKLHCIVMEKIDGCDLLQWVVQNQPITESQALDWLKQLVSAIDYLQKKNYLHGDIRPNNIMLAPNEQIILIDFGVSRKMNTFYKILRAWDYILLNIDKFINERKIRARNFNAPERRKFYCSLQSDFHSLGQTFIYLTTGKKPWDEVIFDFEKDKFDWYIYAPHISSKFVKLIEGLTEHDPKKRPQTTQSILDELEVISSNLYQTTQKNSGV